MRCVCCDKILTVNEDSLKNLVSGEREQVCFRCLDGLNIKTSGTSDVDDWQGEWDEAFPEDYLYEDEELDEEWRDS